MYDALTVTPSWPGRFAGKEQPLTQEQLLARLRGGDADALEAVIEQTRPKAYRLAYSIVQDHDRCEDVLQDTYCIVLEKHHQLREPAAFGGWFTRILINRARAELRQRWDFLDDLPEVQTLACPRAGLEDQLALHEALRSLGAADRAILTLREVWELPYQEIAEALSIPLGTVASRIFKARQRLLAHLSRREEPRR